VFKQWRAARPTEWIKQNDVVAMDGFAGFKTAAEQLSDAVPVMDPFHVVRIADGALGQHQRRVQQDLFGRRGMTPHLAEHRCGPADRPAAAGLDAVFDSEEHNEVEATWGIYQRIVAAYGEPTKKKVKLLMQAAVTAGVPTALVEIRRLGRTMKQRAMDILAFFDRPGTSNGPTETINGRPERLNDSALGFRDLTTMSHAAC
jgi:transposase